MTPEREKLIRDTWAIVRLERWPVHGEVLNVATPRKPFHLTPERCPAELDPPSERYLSFERGVEYSEDGLWERRFIECEGVRVDEAILPRKTKGR